MASSHSNTHTDEARKEQIITEFFFKSSHIIIESRSPCMSSRNYSGEQIVSSPASSTSSSSSARRDKWFNLALGECPTTLDSTDIWRQSYLEPIIVDVILVQRPGDWEHVNCSPKRDVLRNFSLKEQYPFGGKSEQEELGSESKNEMIIERWVVQYESRKPRDCGSGSRRSSNSLPNLYKKLILLFRSLYVTIRLLPAYKIFRDLNSSGQLRPLTLTHRVSSFVEPFTRKEESEMQRLAFPVETSCDRFSVSVMYRSSLSDVYSGSSTPMSPQFIPDYVGSPLADPLKRFPSLPMSPSSLPCSRRHSWSNDHYKASPPSISFSPSPTHSEPRALHSNPSSRRFMHMNLPPPPPETSSAHNKNTSFDEYCPSPNFSPSPSPSPPIYIPGSHLSKALLRSDSAPVSVPAAMHVGSPALSNKQYLPPSPPLKVTRSGNPRTDRSTGLVQTGATVEKFFSLGKDDTRKYPGLNISSNNSRKISFSGSSSRSLHDEFDISEFPCPFDVEDDDMTDPGSRPESFDQKGPLDPGGFFPIRKSQEAGIGALVDMLNKAAPLRQDSSVFVDLSQDSGPKMWSSSLKEQNLIPETQAVQQVASSSVASSGLVALKTTADALEELRGYKEMVKGLLHSQAGRPNPSVNYTAASKSSNKNTTAV